MHKIGIQDYNIQKGNIHDLTGHDIIITVKEGTLFAEIKIEDYWPYITDNITLDAISIFSWNNTPKKVKTIRELLPLITVKKYGTLYNSNDDIMIKMIRDIKTERQDYFAYNIVKLQSRSFISYVEQNCLIKVNPKKSYDLDDTWESAFFCIKISDSVLQQTEIKSIADISVLF